ncbi:MAG TPA: fibronectin type III domain-containing protein [Cyclobacteriaceae bacterium]|nr:fibronectin type III domain-containing protein [Cyclobacteriaceae bacterium]
MRKGIFSVLLALLACQVNEADAPEMSTQDAQQIGATSVVMGAEIKEIGPIRPMNYGFLWDTQSDLSVIASANKLVLGSASGPKTYSIKLDNLTKNTTYYYRSFTANEDYSKIYYGNTVSFKTLN